METINCLPIETLYLYLDGELDDTDESEVGYYPPEKVYSR